MKMAKVMDEEGLDGIGHRALMPRAVSSQLYE
jgi:hypothetical protein